MNRWRATLCAGALLGAFFVSGCHASPYVTITVTNVSGGDIHQMELDYPGASMGTNYLANGASYHQSVQFRGTANARLIYNDMAGKPRQSSGPSLHEGERGSLNVRLTPGGSVAWDADVSDAPR